MSGTLNKVMLIGHLGDEVKIHRFEDGGCVGRFPLATNETYMNKQTNEIITGNVTDSFGQFLIKDIFPGNHIVKFEFMGYNTKIIEKIVIRPRGKMKWDLGVIKLEQTLLEMDEVTIIDKKPIFEFETDKIDWGMGEMLAYGSLLKDGFNVRISGQDVERGTFSHRHAILKVEDSEEEICLLNNIDKNQGNFSIYNSHLSEYGVMGYEYGYSLTSPKTLCIWEAQFGDFSNGAQIIIDQYLFSGEAKWKTQNGLVLFLPHGYEGQGAEHSSARMERYLQLCAKDNVFVANCTTPANMFHILRRQLKANYRKPLIIFTPKSLLRHPMVHSSVDDFVKGEFNLLIDDNSVSVEDVKSVVFVSGKFYYDILEERERQGRNDVAIVRLEQLFPLPKEHIKSIIKKYQNADDIVWAQEEPINMGAYAHLLINLKESRKFRVAARRFYSATAAGSSARYLKRHKEVIDFIFDKNKNNQIPE